MNRKATPRPHDRLTTTLWRERGGGDPCHEQTEHTADQAQNEPADLEAPTHWSGIIVWIGGRRKEGECSVLAERWLLLSVAWLL